MRELRRMRILQIPARRPGRYVEVAAHCRLAAPGRLVCSSARDCAGIVASFSRRCNGGKDAVMESQGIFQITP